MARELEIAGLRVERLELDLIYTTIDCVQSLVTRLVKQGLTTIPEVPFRRRTVLAFLESSAMLFRRRGGVEAFPRRLHPCPNILSTRMSE